MNKLQKFRHTIKDLQTAMESSEKYLDESHFPVKHHFTNGAYTREFFMPKGTVVVGKIHRHNHMMMLLQGEAIVVDFTGTKHLTAPFVGESLAGVQRAVHALRDCVFVTVHVTELTDLNKIEAYVIAPNYNALEDKT